MLFFIIFVIIPLTEIALFLQVGDIVGVLPTLLLCVVTAMIGAGLIRMQGIHTLFQARESLQSNILPVKALFDGLCLVISGVLLMTPGFFTDAIGFLLLVPAVRTMLRHYLAKKFEIYVDGAYEDDNLRKSNRPGASSTTTIEVEYERLDSDEDSPDAKGENSKD